MKAAHTARAVHAALLRQPWQQRRQPRLRLSGMLGLLALPVGAAALLTGIGLAQTLGALGLVWLVYLWWLQVEGLFAQNRPGLARLLPGQVRGLRQSLFAQALLFGAAAFACLSLALGPRPQWLLPIALMQLLIAGLAREPLLWFVAAALLPQAQRLRAPLVWAQAQPASLQLLLGLGLLGLLVACIGGGGRWHRASFDRLRRWQLAMRAQAQGRATPVLAKSDWLRPLARLFDWPLRLWRRRLLRAPRPANRLARWQLGLGCGGQWPMLLWIGLLVFGAVVISLLLVAHRPPLPVLIDNASFGIGLYSMICSVSFTRLGLLWGRRREQALLQLLPGLPGGEALLAAWRREHLLAWSLATALALGVAQWGSAHSVNQLAAAAAPCLPLAWLVQWQLRWQVRRQRGALGFQWLALLPAAAGLLAYPLSRAGLPAWLSLGTGAVVYLLCAWRLRGQGLSLPLGRADWGWR